MSSHYAMGFHLCRTCGVIDRDAGRIEVGAKCKSCQVPQKGGLMAFHVGILILIDLINEAGSSSSAVEQVTNNQSRRLGTVVFFCTLREALMNWFVEGLLNALRVPERIGEQLTSDNKLAHQKFGPLFEALTGDKWSVGVKNASRLAKKDFSQISELMKSAANQRNAFLHTGVGWEITDELADQCLDSVCTLVSLFAHLHNAYTYPLLKSNV